MFAPESIGRLLVENIPHELILGIDEALDIGARRAYKNATGMNEGHLPHALGQQRHFHMNETFHLALESGGAAPSPIKGNSVVFGRAGMFTLARFNIKLGMWINAKRSATRRQMAAANKAMEPLVQVELFDAFEKPTGGTVFFVSCFSNSTRFQPERPVVIEIAVPNAKMNGWLFREEISAFAARYSIAKPQEDNVKPILKERVRRQGKDGAAI